MKKIMFAFLAALAVMSFAGCKKKGGTADIIGRSRVRRPCGQGQQQNR
jgi:hypothetical protein